MTTRDGVLFRVEADARSALPPDVRGVAWACAGTRVVAVDAATGAVLETRDLAPGGAVALAAGAPGAWVGLQLDGGVPIRRR